MQRYNLQVDVYDGAGDWQYEMETGIARINEYYYGGKVTVDMRPTEDGKYLLVSDFMKYKRYLLKKWRNNATKT
jgi:hypothetical protein